MEEVFGVCHSGDDFAEARSWQLATLQDKKLEDDTPLKLLRQIYTCRKLQETIFILGATATFFQDPTIFCQYPGVKFHVNMFLLFIQDSILCRTTCFFD